MAKRRRAVPIQLYVSEQEYQAIKQKVESAGYGSLSAYAREMLLNGAVKQIDFTELRALNRELGNLNRNLHQIVYRAALLNDLHETDYQDILRIWTTIRTRLNRVLLKLTRRSHGADDGIHKDSPHS